jgi:UDP-glucose 4-epimerase
MVTRSVLVTGGNGFIGRHLVRRLLRSGCEVTLLQRSPERIEPPAALLRLSRLDAKSISAALGGRHFDWVFILAGYGVHPNDRDAETMFQINVAAVRSIVDVACSLDPSAVVLAGSGSEYNFDGVERPVAEEHALEAYKAYGASKAAGTLCAASLAAARQLPFAACRIFGVYGPGEPPHRLLPSLLKGAQGNDRIPLSLGFQKRDFLFVDDVVDALINVAEFLQREPQQCILNVGTGEPISVRRFTQTAAAMLGIAEDRLGFGDIPMRPDEAMVFSGNPAKLHTFTGWKATVNLNDGIRRCLAVDMPAHG